MSTSFLLDASGFGRVLPRIFDLDVPSNLPSRRSIFTHIQDNISDVTYDREKILIVIHPEHPDVWYWLIPFNDGRSSVGVVAESDYFDSLGADALDALLLHAISASPNLSALLKNAKFDTGVQSVQGYSCNVHSLYGEGYALLGNAGEFLDPVFSSGVTIAMKSASLAAPLVSKQLQGEHVDWQQEYADKLMVGVDTFRAYVEGWYGGTFQDVVFAEHQNPEIRRMVSSILAGYAWDQSNPFVQNPERRLKAIAELCAP